MTDLRHAFRTLAATPIVTMAAVLSLALGIGANTAIFSLINGLVLRPLPVADPERLAIVRGETVSWSNPVWEQIRSHEKLFDGALAWGTPRLDLSQGGQSQIVDGLYVSGGFFDVLGVRTRIGRAINRADDRRGSGIDGPVAVISHEFWMRHFGGAGDVVGTSLMIRTTPFTIVGVTPKGFFGPDVGRSFDVAIPLGSESLLNGNESLLDERNSRFLRIMIRLRPDQTLASATAALASVQAQVREATIPPEYSSEMRARYLTRPLALEAASGGESRLTTWVRPLYLMFIVVASVLLIACANIANLLLARSAARRQEMSVRVALGASSGRLLALLFSESAVLAGIGATLGLVFSFWTSRLLVSQLSTEVNRVHVNLTPDWRVFVFASGLACGTALLFGVLPARRAMRANPNEALLGRGAASARGSRVAGALVVVQVALSLTLVVAAGLFTRTFAALTTLPLGFESDRLLAVNLAAPSPQFRPEDVPELFGRVREATAAVPGIERSAMSLMVPFASTSNAMIRVDTDAVTAPLRPAHVNAVSPGWFDTFRIPIVRGRDIGERDRIGSMPVALVNEAFMRTYLSDSDPIGRRIQSSRRDLQDVEIVGVTGDAVYSTLREPPPPTIYYALAQQRGWSYVYLHVRSAVDSPESLTPALTTAIGNVHSGIYLRFRTIDDQIRASLTRERLLSIVTMFFGVLGVLLAGIGLFGVTSYAVTQRRAEISVRLAIGATPKQIVGLILRRVAVLVSTGVAAGTVLTWWLAQFVSATQLYGVQSRDFPTIAAAALLLAAVAILAGWWPARRAARVDPAPLLREA